MQHVSCIGVVSVIIPKIMVHREWPCITELVIVSMDLLVKLGGTPGRLSCSFHRRTGAGGPHGKLRMGSDNKVGRLCNRVTQMVKLIFSIAFVYMADSSLWQHRVPET